MKKNLLLFPVMYFLACVNTNWTSKKFPIVNGFYFESKTSEYKGYTWIYLCKEQSDKCIDIYKGRDSLDSQYFERVESISIDTILHDTICYSIISVHLGTKICLFDTLLLPNGRLLSNDSHQFRCNSKLLNWTAANMGFSVMLAEEYILVDISLSALSCCDLSPQHQL